MWSLKVIFVGILGLSTIANAQVAKPCVAHNFGGTSLSIVKEGNPNMCGNSSDYALVSPDEIKKIDKGCTWVSKSSWSIDLGKLNSSACSNAQGAQGNLCSGIFSCSADVVVSGKNGNGTIYQTRATNKGLSNVACAGNCDGVSISQCLLDPTVYNPDVNFEIQKGDIDINDNLKVNKAK